MTILPKSKKSHLKSDRTERRIQQASDRNERVYHVKPQPNLSGNAASSSCLPKTFGGATKNLRKDLNNPLFASQKLLKRRPVTENENSLLEEAPNSDDEYGEGFNDDELEHNFIERIKTIRGFTVKEVKGDGACMFRAVADQIYGDEEMHHEVRRLCMDYVAKNRDHFSQFITEDFNEYLARKRLDNVHGNHVELQAMSEIFLRPIEVFEYSTDPINTFHPISREANTGVVNPPIRLSYHGSVHYNSVVDPFSPTIGVGLGLPEYQPGLADRTLMQEATLASERQHIEEAMLKDKMKMTDWERTEEELSRQIANESYMEYLKNLEGQTDKKKDSRKSPSHDRNLPHSTQKLVASRSRPKQKSPNPYEETDEKQHKHQNAIKNSFTNKRGASSPNLPCTSMEGEFSHLAKIHRQDYSSSMPNIDANFGSSLNQSSVKPSTSQKQQEEDKEEKPSTSQQVNQTHSVVEELKKEEKTEPTSSSVGLYEELLVSSASYGDWDNPAMDDTAILAQVLAASQKEFLLQLEKQKNQGNNEPKH